MDDAEIREFLRGDYARLVNAMTLICGSLQAAEDAVQESLARAWELTERGRHIESLPAWVTAVARNLLRDRFRRILVERRIRDGVTDPSHGRSVDPGEVERRADIARALAALPRRQREVAVFRYYLDLDVAEIVHQTVLRLEGETLTVVDTNDQVTEVQPPMPDDLCGARIHDRGAA